MERPKVGADTLNFSHQSTIKMTTQEILKQCTVNGNVVSLPPQQLERTVYQDVAKALNLIGGKWKGGKIAGFVFDSDPTDLLQQISNGETRNLKKEYQFFETPAELAAQLVDLAKLPAQLWPPSFTVLEPSAGRGAIIKAIHKYPARSDIHAFELMDINRTVLQAMPNVLLSPQPDFLQYNGTLKFNRIIANPPFSKNQDIDHILKMYSLLKEGGRLVSISSKHWQISANKKETEFRTWLESVNADIVQIERGTFKESGTMIESIIIVIDK